MQEQASTNVERRSGADSLTCAPRVAGGAFTLIELLIVVAIIAILAAIAVPNFLEAQTRSKVSRAKADLRTIATALEAYHVDHDGYPPNPDPNVEFNVTPFQITTPVAYITSRPVDPFKIGHDVTQGTNPSLSEDRFFYDYYEIIETEEYIQRAAGGADIFVIGVDASGALSTLANRGALLKYGGWLQWSIGPDVRFWVAEDDFTNPGDPSGGLADPVHLPWGYSFDVPYDPTNGTISFGNLIRSQVKPDGAIPYAP